MEKEPKPEPKPKVWGWWFFVTLLVAGVLATCVFVLWKHFHHFHFRHRHRHNPKLPGFTKENYGDALGLAVQFFDVQKSGKLVNNKISWRGDSGLNDGKEANLDLSKGVYDAGDLVKFGFPMAFTATILSWSILEYGDHMKTVNKLEHVQDSLKWITDYLINAHPSENVLYIQVGDPEIDHKCWQRPENTTENRPLTQINTTFPGTEVAAETAAAMASASLVFKSINSTYSKILLNHAKELFSFGDTYRGSYSVSIPQVKKYYDSSGYEDELLWAATWLYIASGDESYLKYVTVENGSAFANWGSQSWFYWNNKLAGTQVLLSRIHLLNVKGISSAENTGLEMYKSSAEAVLCGLLPDSPSATSSRTDSGLISISQFNNLQFPAAAAFLAVLYSDYMLKSQIPHMRCGGKLFKPIDLRYFAKSQADYIMGNNPMGMSYLVGYGKNYPKYVHHRGSSIPVNATTGCSDGFKWLHSTDPNPNIAIGALVGGPFINETYVDFRNNFMQAEPTTYNNALIVALLSGLLGDSPVAESF